MNTQPNLGHSIIPQPIGHLPDKLSGGDINAIKHTSENIALILDSSSQEQLNNTQSRLGMLLLELENEVERISDECGFSYETNDYNYRLAQPKSVMDNFFQEILSNNKKLDSIYNDLNQLLSNLPLEQNVQELLYKKYYERLTIESFSHNFEKLGDIYEISKKAISISDVKQYLGELKSNGIIGYRYISQELPEENSSNQYFYEQINLICDAGITYLAASLIRIKLKLEELIKVIGLIGKAGIRYLDISLNDKCFSSKYKPSLFNEFIKTAGESGIKGIDLYGDGLGHFYYEEADDFITFIKTAGESGIKSINLKFNSLNAIFSNEPEKIITFIKTAGESGIKSIGLGENGLGQIFYNNHTLFFEFIKTAGENGIKNLDLSENYLERIFDSFESFVDFIEIAGLSGIKGMNLKSNELNNLIVWNVQNYDPSLDFLRLLQLLKNVGIKYLGLKENGLFDKTKHFYGATSYKIGDLLLYYKLSTNIKLGIN